MNDKESRCTCAVDTGQGIEITGPVSDTYRVVVDHNRFLKEGGLTDCALIKSGFTAEQVRDYRTAIAEMENDQ